MDIWGLDQARRPVKTLRCLNVQWNRRYYEPGDFQVQLRACDWDTGIRYLDLRERPETGMVQKVETQRTVKGDFVLVGGYFLEGMLNWKALYPRVQASGNVSALCRSLVADRLTDVGITVSTGASLGGIAALDTLGEPLGDVTFALLRQQGLSQRIRMDDTTGALTYEVWQGMNRTQRQQSHPYAVFSQGFGTVDGLTLTQDSSDYRNFVIAAYADTTMALDCRTDLTEPVRSLYLDTGLTLTDGQAEADLLAAVRTRALTELARHPYQQSLNADTLQNNLFYRTDYDLGDLCDVRDDRLNLSFEARILEVNEVWKENAHTVTLEFGDESPTVG
jgi:hypothetical protein